MVNIFADLELSMKAMRLHTMSTTPNTAINTKHVFLVLSMFFMDTARIKEIALEKSTKPICVFYINFAAYLQQYRTSKLIYRNSTRQLSNSNHSNYKLVR